MHRFALSTVFLCATAVLGVPYPRNDSSLIVDLGYAVYQGFPDYNTGLNAWQGMRYAAPPTGDLRWRAPQAPLANHSGVIASTMDFPQCPQAPNTPLEPGFNETGEHGTSEDCLYLSVFAPPGAKNLPVLFYIHGGGYGLGAAVQNFTQMAQVDDYGFVAVDIQYRLEAFGFLSSTAVHNDGTPNAGLLDQQFAMQWVQDHIAQFGGNPRKVSIIGESAGGGSVEMHALAHGGSDGTKYFDQGIAASPYTPTMWNYDDAFPERQYLRLAKAVNCYAGDVNTVNSDPSILECLRKADSQALITADKIIGSSVNFGSWAFVPVVDGDFIQQLPSQQFPQGKVNGRQVLVGHNSNEGAAFVRLNITTAEDFDSWIYSEYPNITSDDLHQINTVYYPYRNESAVPFATCGDCGGPNAVNVGSFAVGNQQRAIDFYSEATFVCPAYWMAGAYRGEGQAGYSYQFSIPPGQHGLDQVAESIVNWPSFFTPMIGGDLHTAVTTSWGNFIIHGNPSITNLQANGVSTNNDTFNPASDWPIFSTSETSAWQMLNLNQTGGTYYRASYVSGYTTAQYEGPGLRNDFTQVNAYAWEGGQGRRCEFLQSIGRNIPV